MCVVSVLFGGLSLFAAVVQLKAEKKSIQAVLMILGSAVLIAAVACNFAAVKSDYIIALLGSAAICAAAIWNGVKGRNFHIQHHVIRILLSLILVVGFILL